MTPMAENIEDNIDRIARNKLRLVESSLNQDTAVAHVAELREEVDKALELITFNDIDESVAFRVEAIFDHVVWAAKGKIMQLPATHSMGTHEAMVELRRIGDLECAYTA